MSSRLLGIVVAGAVALVAAAGCDPIGADCSDVSGGALTKREFDIEADLHAVTQIAAGTHGYLVAVGSRGTVAVFRDYYGPANYGPANYGATNVGADVELRAVTGRDDSIWAVGDSGFVAVSHDRGESWEPVDLGTTADLHAATVFGSAVVIAGDEFVRVLPDEDGVWIEPPVPDGGWGRLRGMHVGELASADESEPAVEQLWAVGLDGATLSTLDPSGAWTVEDSSVSADLFAVGSREWDRQAIVAVGADGTVVERGEQGFAAVETEVTADLIDYDNSLAVSADGDVYEHGETLRFYFARPGLRAIAADEGGFTTVGEDGAVYTKEYVWCY